MRKHGYWLMIIAIAACVVMASAGQGRQDDSQPTVDRSVTAMGLMLIEDADGVYVLAVADNSPAARAGIEPGDRLEAVNGAALASVAQMEEAFAGNTASDPVQVLVTRDGKEYSISLRWRR